MTNETTERPKSWPGGWSQDRVERAIGADPEGPPHQEIISQGKVYPLSAATPGIRKAFAAWCRQQALILLEEDKDFLTPEEYAQRLERIKKRIDAGAYRWGPPHDPRGMGSGVVDALDEGSGWAWLIKLLLGESVSLEQAVEIVRAVDGEELRAKVRVCLGLSPNASTPEKSPGMKQADFPSD